MAGSMKYFVYTTDDGDDFAVWRDESNIELLNGGTQDYPNNGSVKYKCPSNVKPRYVRFRSLDGTVTRKLECLTRTIWDGVIAGTTVSDVVSGLTLVMAEKVGEVITIPVGQDTGLTDGDAT